MQFLYLIGLILSIIGLIIIDWRHNLAFFDQPKRTGLTVAITMCIFIIWDIVGIHLGIFFSGNSPYALTFMIVPDFPIEELFFLFLLSYVTLLIYRGVEKRWKPIS